MINTLHRVLILIYLKGNFNLLTEGFIVTSKAVYMIGDVDIKNIEEYKKYMEKVKP